MHAHLHQCTSKANGAQSLTYHLNLLGATPNGCKTNEDILPLFNSMFLLQMQKSWTVYCPNCTVVTRVISILQMKPFALDNWMQLPKVGWHVGNIGAHTSDQWEWIHTYSRYPLAKQSNASKALQPQPEQDTMETDNRCKVALSLAQSQPLAR